MDETRQVGRYQGSAAMWYGTSASLTILHPAGATGGSEAYAIAGDQQVGFSGWGSPSPGFEHASLWRGNAASFVDLNPSGATRSVAYATDGQFQGGSANVPGLHAALWAGTASSFVDINPVANMTSKILGMAPGQQVGWTQAPQNTQHATIWSGTAASWVDVHPFPGYGGSILYATTGQVQVGDSHVPGSGVPHAGVWFGTAASFIDLHQFLPPGYFSSGAYAVYQDSSGIIIGGNAVNSLGRTEAFVWTTIPSPGALGLAAFACIAAARRSKRAGADGYTPALCATR